MKRETTRNLFFAMVALGVLSMACSMTSTPTKPPVDELFVATREDAEHNSKHGYIDKSGKFVLGPFESFEHKGVKYDNKDKYYSLRSFSEGMAGICLKEAGDYATNGTCGYLGRDGKIAIEPKFKEISFFSEGFAAVSEDGKSFYYIDKTGKRLGDRSFQTTSPFSEGLAMVYGDKNYQYIDTSGKPAFEQSFESARPFGDGHAAVRLNGKMTIIDKSGKALGECPASADIEGFDTPTVNHLSKVFNGYDELDYVSPSFVGGVISATGGYIDLKCKYAAENREKAPDGEDWTFFQMNDGVGLMKIYYSDVDSIGKITGIDMKSEGWFYVDKTGKKLHPKPYQAATLFFEKIACVKEMDSNLWYIINDKFEKITPAGFYDPVYFRGGLAVANFADPPAGFDRKRYSGYINSKGEPVMFESGK